jgi:hypothetical protein
MIVAVSVGGGGTVSVGGAACGAWVAPGLLLGTGGGPPPWPAKNGRLQDRVSAAMMTATTIRRDFISTSFGT